MKKILLALALMLCPQLANAQTPIGAMTVSSCGNQSLTAGKNYGLTQDTTGAFCISSTAAGTTSSNIIQWGSVTLGAPSNYGTSPGAVVVPGVNAFVTNTVGVNGTASNASSAVATSSTNVPAIAYLYGFNGATFDQLQVDGSKNLKINCATGCAASGVVDEAAFTAGTSTYGPVGGFFQTTATSNALTNGQGGWWQMTANRAGFVNIRNSSGTELGVTANPVITAGAGTAGTPAGGVTSVQGVSGGTNLPVSQATAANLNATVVGVGSAGSASGGVVSVQGVASMTPILTNPSTIATWGLMSGTTPGTAPTNTLISGGIYNSSAPTPTTGQTLPLQLASDGSLKVTNSGPLGSAVAASSLPVVIASNQTAADPCMFQAKTNVAISTASGTTAVVTGVSAKKIYVCSLSLVAATAISVSLSEGSSSTCGTSNQAAVLGVATSGTAANGIALAANGGLTLGNGGGTVAATATNANYLCLFQSGTAQIAGNLTYVQQ